MTSKKGKGKATEDAPSMAPAPMLNAIPKPVASFDMSNVLKLEANYAKFVKAIQDEIGSSTDVKFRFKVGGKEIIVPVTPGKDNSSRGTYVIEVTDGEKRLYLVGEKYQSWFRGIVTDKGRRYEVDDELPKVMEGSRSLHTNGLYPKLITRGRGVAALKLGYQGLFQAFHALATLGEDGNEVVTAEMKEAIAILVVMFFEGPRFPAVCNFVKELLRRRRDDIVGQERGNLINNWCDISKDFYEAVNGNDGTIIISEETSQAVKDAAHDLRIMCRSMWDNWLAEQRGTTGGSSSRR